MPKKGGKKKGPAIFTSEEDLAPFGFKMADLVQTPLGITGTVIGVKYENPEQKETGRVWVRYENGNEAPLEPKLGAGHMSALGYRRCSEADHIRRDVEEFMEVQTKDEAERKLIAEIMSYKEAGLEIPEHLLPKPKKPKAAKGAKKK